MWYIGMDIGGTNIDCVAVNEDGARSEVHSIRPVGKLPEEVALQTLQEFMESIPVTKKGIAKVAIGWKQGLDTKAALVMSRQFAKAGIDAEILWDVETAFAGALPDKVGILIQSGTGAHIYSKTPRGAVLTAGGWSALLGDPGSAFAIGQQALVIALKAKDQKDNQLLVHDIPAALHMTLEELVMMAETDIAVAVAHIAGICPLVFQLAAKGNDECIRICDQAAQDLADQAKVVIEQWPTKDPIQVSYAGRLLYAEPRFRQSVHQKVAALSSEIAWREPQFRSTFGAILCVYPKLRTALEKSNQSLDWHHRTM